MHYKVRRCLYLPKLHVFCYENIGENIGVRIEDGFSMGI